MYKLETYHSCAIRITSYHDGMGYLGEDFNEHYSFPDSVWDNQLAQWDKLHPRSFQQGRVMFKFGVGRKDVFVFLDRWGWTPADYDSVLRASLLT